MAPISHIVIFQYKPDTTAAQKEDIANSFLSLQQNCLSPPDNDHFTSPGEPYIQGITAGVNTSTEKVAEGYEHVYIVTLASAQHRDYYTKSDPAHEAFKAKVGPFVKKLLVVDFSDGVW